jgi:predicted Zn-dependent protease
MLALRTVALSAAVLVTTTCATNPATGRRMLSLVSESREVEIGRENDAAVVAQMGLVDDTALQRYVADIGLRLARASERPNLPWTFRVVDDPVVNAFALPGGYIYVSRGILAHFNSEAELAGVLGHEIGHVTARHSVEQISRAQLAQLGVGVAAIAAPRLGSALDIATQGLGLLFLKFSRDDESEADALGLRYLRRGGYDPRELPHVFEMLGRVSATSGGRIPTWQSTHPDPEDRQARLGRAVAALPADSQSGAVRRDEYLRRIDGIVYGDNPREGYFKGSRFYHPDLKWQLLFPAGWATMNSKQAVAAQSPQRDAQLVISAARGTAPDSAANAFFGHQAVRGQPQRRRINGLAAIAGPFTAQTQDGTQLRGSAAFVAYDGLVYEMIGLATPQGWQTHGAAISAALESFAPLADPVILAVRPHRLDVVRLERDLTLPAFAREYPGPASVAALGRINNVDSTATLGRGRLVKRVVGEALP